MRIVFMGTPDFAVPALTALLGAHDVCLVVTQPDKPAGRKKRVCAPPVKIVAQEAGVSVLQLPSTRTPEFLERMQQEQADVAVVVAYGKILPPSVLEVFPLGCLNIHGSLLPKYRGAAPIQRAVMNGEKTTGVSIMRLDEGLDTGPVLLSRAEPIHSDDTAGTLFERLAPIGASAVLEALQGLELGALEARPQDESEASYAAILKKQDGLINWQEDAQTVAARIRGLDPWPCAFVPLAGGNLKVFGARETQGNGFPGTVLACDDTRGMVVACGVGAVAVDQVQAPGKNRIASAAYARGRRLEIGTVLSNKEESS